MKCCLNQRGFRANQIVAVFYNQNVDIRFFFFFKNLRQTLSFSFHAEGVSSSSLGSAQSLWQVHGRNTASSLIGVRGGEGRRTRKVGYSPDQTGAFV